MVQARWFLKNPAFVLFSLGDPNLQCLWYYFHIFNLDKKYNLISIWWTFKFSHSSHLEAKNMFWFWLSRAPSSILSSSVKRPLPIGSRFVLKYILIFWTFSELILLLVTCLHRAFFQGVKELKADFPEKVVIASIMCRFYRSSRHQSHKLRNPYLSIQSMVTMPILKQTNWVFFTVTAKRTGRSLLNLL